MALDGTLRVELINGYIATLGDLFTILSWGGTLTGNFSTFVFHRILAPRDREFKQKLFKLFF